MRALAFLVAAICLAAYLFVADPFGTPKPERCPGGICPTPEHTTDVDVPLEASFAQASLVKTVPLSQPILRAAQPTQSSATVHQPIRELPISKDGWRIRLLYPYSARGIARSITDEINGHDPLSKFCNRFAFASLSTSDERFNDWFEMGYPDDSISLVLVSPTNESIYYVHHVLKSPSQLLSSLQEKMDGYYAKRDGWSARSIVTSNDRRPRR